MHGTKSMRRSTSVGSPSCAAESNLDLKQGLANGRGVSTALPLRPLHGLRIAEARCELSEAY